jgi:hypothetical protein
VLTLDLRDTAAIAQTMTGDDRELQASVWVCGALLSYVVVVYWPSEIALEATRWRLVE